jgi:hypothetical protein
MLLFENSTANIDSNSVMVNYTVIAPGLPVQVSCSAQSLNSQQFSTDTSRGQESTFQLAFPEAILQPSLSRFIGLPVDVVLSIFPPSSSEQGDDIIFRCSAERVLSNESDFSEMSRNFCVDILQNVDMNTTLLSNGTQLSNNLPIMVAPETIKFEPGIQHQRFQIISNTAGSSTPLHITSLLLLVCCSIASGSLQLYHDLVAHHLINVNMQPTIASAATTTGDLTATSVSCSCDLMLFVCDISCCCDPDCSTEDNQVFGDICVTEGQMSSSGFDESCSSISRNEDKMYGMLCVERDSNPNKGLSYKDVDVASNNAIYDSLRSRMKSSSSYSPQSNRNPEVGEIAQQVYRSGDPILTQITHIDGTVAVGQLTLPTAITGSCSEANPIGYLVDSHTACTRLVSLDSCSAESTLSVLFYLLPDSFPRGKCLSSVAVKSTPSSDDISRTCFEYYCNSTRLAKVNFAAWEFSLEPKEDIFNDVFAEYELCEFAEGLMLQNVPQATRFNNYTRVCENVIQQLEYIFYWHAGSVVAVKARYLITNISLREDKTRTSHSDYSERNSTPSMLLAQQFSVKFMYVTENIAANVSVDSCITHLPSLLNLSATYAGNIGYSIDSSSPLQSGLFDYGSNKINTNFMNQLRLWKSSGDSSCSVVGREQVLFGQDTLSGCLLTLTLEDLRYNCNAVRQNVTNAQTSIVTASHVGQYATADPEIESDWVEILKSGMDMNNLTNVSGTLCADVPAHVDIYVAYSMLTADQSADLWQIIGVKINMTYFNWEFACKSECKNDSYTNKFLVTSAIQFIEVPPKKEPRVTRSVGYMHLGSV